MTVVQSRVATTPGKLLQIGDFPGGVCNFGQSQREQIQNPHPAGQRLGNVFHQQKILRTGKDEAQGRIAVHPALQIREQQRYSLSLIQNSPLWETVLKTARVLFGQQACVRIF